MKKLKHPIPDWVTRGKTIRQLIKELKTFDDLDAEVRISVDYGDTSHTISIVEHREEKCVLVSADSYYRNEWQSFVESERGSGDDA